MTCSDLINKQNLVELNSDLNNFLIDRNPNHQYNQLVKLIAAGVQDNVKIVKNSISK